MTVWPSPLKCLAKSLISCCLLVELLKNSSRVWITLFCYSIYIPKYTLSKKLICSIAVLPLCLKTLKKIPVKESNFIVKVSSLGPATISKNEPFHFLFFKHFDHDCTRTILESTFPWLFSETFLAENRFILKFRENISYNIFPDKHRVENNKHRKALKLSERWGPF